LAVVVDHDSGALVWAAPGRDEATLRGFFDLLGAERAVQITHVSADAANRIAAVVAERCPNAIRCADAFRVVAWATLRLAFVLKGEAGKQSLERWISWARRCRIPAFVKLQQRIVKHRAAIDAALDSGLSNALVESTNTKIRLITRIAFGFHGPEPLIALAMLSLGSHPSQLPGRN